jgi:CSLREA domain-containing protein
MPPVDCSGSIRLEQKLTAPDAGARRHFGGKVAISGNTAAVSAFVGDSSAGGTQGVHIYVHDGTAWVWQQTLTRPNYPADHYGSGFGTSLALSGDTLVVGAPNSPRGAGHETPLQAAYVFKRTGTHWYLQAELNSSLPRLENFGATVAISGDTIVVGASDAWLGPTEVGRGYEGTAFVFVRNGSSWSQQQQLEPARGYTVSENFGFSLAIDGDTIVVGTDYGVYEPGSAYVFVRDGSIWTQQQWIRGPDPSEITFGNVVALSGDKLLVAAPDPYFDREENPPVYAYARVGTRWELRQSLEASGSARQTFGTSLALDGETAVIGSISRDPYDTSVPIVGAAYVFEFNGTTWLEEQKLSGDPDRYDLFGWSAGLSDERIVVSNPYKGINGNDFAGALYVFKIPLVRLSISVPDEINKLDEPFTAAVSLRLRTGRPATVTFDDPLLRTDKEDILEVEGVDLPPPVTLTPEARSTTFPVSVSPRQDGFAKLLSSAVAANEAESENICAEREIIVNPCGTLARSAEAGSAALSSAELQAAAEGCEIDIKVNLTSDEADSDLEDGTCDVDAEEAGQQCSLRAAIQTANAKAGTDFITFDIPGGGVQTISPRSPLPAITEKVFINGRSQPGYVDKPVIQLFGTAVRGAEGLVFAAGSSGSSVSGMAINRFSTGVLLQSDDNTIQKCFLGMDADGITIPSSSDRQQYGIKIIGKNNTIGAPRDNETGIGNNHVYGNIGAGVWITGAKATGNKVVGSNFGVPFGADTNSERERVSVDNIRIDEGAAINTIGGTTREETNFILTATTGISIRKGANNNFITGNLISQCHNGVYVGDASTNTIGGTVTAGARNYIVDNEYGIHIGDVTTGSGQSGTALDNKIYGNVLGLTEQLVFSGNDYGIVVANAQNTTIGSGVFGEHNFISNSVHDGIVLTKQATGTKVLGNFIGTDIAARESPRTTTECSLPGSDNEVRNNTISGNNNDGVRLVAEALGGSDPTGNSITNNRVGTNGTGTSAIPNGGNGISLSGSGNSVTSNLIAGNERVGISVRGDNNALLNNKVGTDATGMSALPNVVGGIGISGTGNIVRANQVSGNGGGLQLVPNQDNLAKLATGNSIEDNKVGINADMTAALPNQSAGIVLSQASNNSFTGNTIAGNKGSGMQLQQSSNNNVVRGNFVGVTPAGLALPNQGHGISLTSDSSGNQIGGNTRLNQSPISGTMRVALRDAHHGAHASLSTEADKNIIAHNGGNGIHLSATAGSGNAMGANSLFANALSGIDLGGDGFTANDPADADAGPNKLQNYPALVTCSIIGGDLIVSYQVDSAPENSNYGSTGIYVEFFEADSSGEGRGVVGSDYYTANDYAGGTPGTRQKNLGNAAALRISAGNLLTAAASDFDGNSSEFTPPATVTVVTVITPTPTPTATATPTPTPSPSASPSATPSTSPSPSPDPTASPSPTPSQSSLQLLNISTRLNVKTGENVLIGGIIITGTEPKKVILRAIGPSLGAQGVKARCRIRARALRRLRRATHEQ